MPFCFGGKNQKGLVQRSRSSHLNIRRTELDLKRRIPSVHRFINKYKCLYFEPYVILFWKNVHFKFFPSFLQKRVEVLTAHTMIY